MFFKPLALLGAFVFTDYLFEDCLNCKDKIYSVFRYEI